MIRTVEMPCNAKIALVAIRILPLVVNKFFWKRLRLGILMTNNFDSLQMTLANSVRGKEKTTHVEKLLSNCSRKSQKSDL